MIERHSLHTEVLRVLHLRKHLCLGRIINEVKDQGLFIRRLIAEWTSTVAREDGKVLKTETCTPNRVVVSCIVFLDGILVDIVANVEVIATAAREKNCVDLFQLIVCDVLIVIHDEGNDSGASCPHKVGISLHNIGRFSGEAWVRLQLVRKGLGDDADDGRYVQDVVYRLLLYGCKMASLDELWQHNV